MQETAPRGESEDLFHLPMIVTNDEHRFIIAGKLREIGTARFEDIYGRTDPT